MLPLRYRLSSSGSGNFASGLAPLQAPSSRVTPSMPHRRTPGARPEAGCRDVADWSEESGKRAIYLTSSAVQAPENRPKAIVKASDRSKGAENGNPLPTEEV